MVWYLLLLLLEALWVVWLCVAGHQHSFCGCQLSHQQLLTLIRDCKQFHAWCCKAAASRIPNLCSACFSLPRSQQQRGRQRCDLLHWRNLHWLHQHHGDRQRRARRHKQQHLEQCAHFHHWLWQHRYQLQQQQQCNLHFPHQDCAARAGARDNPVHHQEWRASVARPAALQTPGCLPGALGPLSAHPPYAPLSCRPVCRELQPR